MSLLKRIESARPAGPANGERAVVPAPAGPPGGSGPGGVLPPSPPPVSASLASSARLATTAPVRESFRDVKFRIQSRVISDLDPKLDLANQVEVRRQIEEIFGKVIDEEGLALTRAERVRMLEQITDEIIGLGPSSRSCATRASPRSWSTAPARCSSSGAARSSSPRSCSRTTTT